MYTLIDLTKKLLIDFYPMIVFIVLNQTQVVLD